jgi:hypothetical protein
MPYGCGASVGSGAGPFSKKSPVSTASVLISTISTDMKYDYKCRLKLAVTKSNPDTSSSRHIENKGFN